MAKKQGMTLEEALQVICAGSLHGEHLIPKLAYLFPGAHIPSLVIGNLERC